MRASDKCPAGRASQRASVLVNLANASRQPMNHDPANEPPIDLSLNHYMEEKALTVARDKAETETAGQRAKVEVQIQRRITLMELRASFTRLAVARRHARGRSLFQGARRRDQRHGANACVHGCQHQITSPASAAFPGRPENACPCT